MEDSGKADENAEGTYGVAVGTLATENDFKPAPKGGQECSSLSVTKVHQMPELFEKEENQFRRTNTYDARCLEPSLVGRVLSLQYRVHWYGAGAAHPNMHFETFNFFLEPVAIIRSFLGIFQDFGAIHTLVQQEVRKQLYAIRLPWDEGERALDPAKVDEGTASTRAWDSFWFTPVGIEFLFSPYEVGPYAAGPQVAAIPYDILLPHMRKEVIAALDIPKST